MPSRELDPPPAAPVDPPTKALRLLSVDHHFAPGVEAMEAVLEIRGYSTEAVRLVVTDAEGRGVLRRPLTAGEKSDGVWRLTWNGRGDDGRCVTPLGAPYAVRVEAESARSESAETTVLFHSLRLRLGAWCEAPPRLPPTPPATCTATYLRAVQHRLNELGYFAGPLTAAGDGDADVPDQTRRALRRFSNELPRPEPTDDPLDPEVLRALHLTALRRTTLENPDVFASPASSSRVLLDDDGWYPFTSEGNPYAAWRVADGHVAHARDTTDRWEFPVEAQPLLVSRLDADGRGEGVAAPEACGAVEIEWWVTDPPEDLSLLPPHVPALSPSNSLAYVRQVRREQARAPDDPEDAGDNCPDALGGVRDAPKFREGSVLAPFVTRLSGERAITQAHVLADAQAAPSTRQGRAGVCFLGSTIGGDDYVLHARVRLDEHPRRAVLESAHEALHGAERARSVLRARTGRFVTWRRRRIAAVITWGDDARAADYFTMVSRCQEAFLELDVSSAATMSIAQVLDDEAAREQYLEILRAIMVPQASAPASHLPERARWAFRAEHLAPGDLVVPRRATTAQVLDAVTLACNELNSALRREVWRIARLLRARWRLRGRPGLLILLPLTLNPDVVARQHRVSRDEVAARVHREATYSLGMCDGVAWIGSGHRARWTDSFLLTHEVAHCLWLQHSFVGTWEAPNDHDRGDLNCAMSYPDKLNERYGLARDVSPEGASALHFCGKCVLKLRGWKVADGTLPASSRGEDEARAAG